MSLEFDIHEARRKLREDLEALDVAAYPHEAVDAALAPLSKALETIETLRVRYAESMLTADIKRKGLERDLRITEAAMHEHQSKVLEMQREQASVRAKGLRADLLTEEINELLIRCGFEYPLGMRGLKDMASHFTRLTDDYAELGELLHKIKRTVADTGSGCADRIEALDMMLKEYTHAQ
jgi:uncharacterized protein YdcH (DUF465 family)